MTRENNGKRGLRPPPPPPPPPAQINYPEQDDKPSTLPKILKIAIIALTLIGIFFAVRAISTHSNENQQSATNNTNGLASDLASTGNTGGGQTSETLPTTPDASVTSTNTETGMSSPIGNVTPVALEKAEKPQLLVDALNVDLGNIEQNFDAQLALTDTTVYQRISENIRQCLRVQLAILKSTTGTKAVDAEYERIQKRLELLQQYDDSPYYSDLIAEYSRLMAETSVMICELIRNDADIITGQRLRNELTTIRRSQVEATCDATFVAAVAMLSASKFQKGAAVVSLTWSEMERSIQAQRASDQHIMQKTEAAHRALCDVLLRSVRIEGGQKGERSKTIERIERELNGDIAKAQDKFFRIAAYTEAETRLMVLWARSLK
jgi:hypothetical protein